MNTVQIDSVVAPGTPKSPCTQGSRWANFALTKADAVPIHGKVGNTISVTGNKVLVNGVHRTRISQVYPKTRIQREQRFCQVSSTCR